MPPRRKNVSLVTTDYEQQARAAGFKCLAGLDEVGRGALAGPVVAAAVILNLNAELPSNLNDSKKLSRTERTRICDELKASCVAYAIGVIEAEEIDAINILQATHKAMRAAIAKINPAPDYLLIDAIKLDVPVAQKAIIGGDAVCASIAAASIIAKVFRDDLMRAYDARFPVYNFKSHVGYGTREHLAALRAHGACPLHRRTFRGVL